MDERTSPSPEPELYFGATYLARLAGVSRQEVHFDFQEGALPIHARTAAGVRLVRAATATRWAAERRKARARE